ncbi:unannotated protein [freshwater metagenome]|uniref:Unannotated protein n=1 Tax=freshwater metagenome TaxID=449393 RepID=A0A6J7SGE2_9ZZZZ
MLAATPRYLASRLLVGFSARMLTTSWRTLTRSLAATIRAAISASAVSISATAESKAALEFRLIARVTICFFISASLADRRRSASPAICIARASVIVNSANKPSAAALTSAGTSRAMFLRTAVILLLNPSYTCMTTNSLVMSLDAQAASNPALIC